VISKNGMNRIYETAFFTSRGFSTSLRGALLPKHSRAPAAEWIAAHCSGARNSAWQSRGPITLRFGIISENRST
jgi:hypothetical protein